MPPYIYIADDKAAAELAACLNALSPQDAVGVDTEFIRVVEYYPKLALLQLRVKGTTYLVDPLSCSLRGVLPALLNTPARFLVFAGDEDLQILAQYAHCLTRRTLLPAQYCDLQRLAAFSGHSFGRGLYVLVKDLCGIELNKEQTLSDWLQRPLSAEQLSYAALDVAYLEELYDKLSARLTDVQARAFHCCMNELKAELTAPVEPALSYRSVGGAGALKPQELALLQHLCEKRLEYAKEHDIALNRVITSKALGEICRTRPRTLEALAGCGMKWGAVRQCGALVLRWINEPLKDPALLKLPEDFFAHCRELHDDYRHLRHALEQGAQKAGIAAQVLGGKKILNEFFLARFEERPALIEQGWRAEIIGPLPELTWGSRDKLLTFVPEALRGA